MNIDTDLQALEEAEVEAWADWVDAQGETTAYLRELSYDEGFVAGVEAQKHGLGEA